GDFESFLMGIATSLYNGAYIDDYKYTKKLITNAYRNNAVQMETFSFANASAPTEAELKSFTKKLRETFLNFKSPSSAYNAWAKVGGYGRAIVSWSKPEDVVVFISNKLASELDVDVLANAFNMSKAELMGKVYYIDSFDLYDDDGVKQYDGSNIYALICDKRWFKIRTKDMFMDEFYNANNRSWQQYLNVIKAFNYSLFANAYMLVGAIPTINITSASFNETSPEVTAGEKIRLHITTVPFNATQTVTFTSGTVGKATVEKIDDRTVEVTGVAAGSSTITATAGGSSIATVSVTVNAAAGS
ncbi:MAG: Ig-like domain-containing protein, partial [Lachnospiraceae bacterium]|nr:Ig-like domain-containing protein [Lachnospiraceae bacterium]